MRILVCGDRNWWDVAYLFGALARLSDERGPFEVVIEGEARGADTYAREWAEGRGVPVMAFPANWAAFGRGAGPIRNAAMLSDGRPDLVVAFHPDLATSRGTADMVRRSRAAGVPVIVLPADECDDCGGLGSHDLEVEH